MPETSTMYYTTLDEALEGVRAAVTLGLGVTLENYDEPGTFVMQWRLSLAHEVPEHDPDEETRDAQTGGEA